MDFKGRLFIVMAGWAWIVLFIGCILNIIGSNLIYLLTPINIGLIVGISFCLALLCVILTFLVVFGLLKRQGKDINRAGAT
jgi:hypothetical protein